MKSTQKNSTDPAQKPMPPECRGCGQEDRCKDIYRKLGETQGPSVAWKVFVAFLLPILILIATAVGTEALLADKVESVDRRRFYSALGGIAGVLVYLIAAYWINNRKRVPNKQTDKHPASDSKPCDRQ